MCMIWEKSSELHDKAVRYCYPYKRPNENTAYQCHHDNELRSGSQRGHFFFYSVDCHHDCWVWFYKQIIFIVLQTG